MRGQEGGEGSFGALQGGSEMTHAGSSETPVMKAGPQVPPEPTILPSRTAFFSTQTRSRPSSAAREGLMGKGEGLWGNYVDLGHEERNSR